jgi:hypothetical protein
MRKSLIPAALTLLFGAAASHPAFAFDNETLRARISFPFHVLNRTLPPGDYVIKSAQGMDPALFEIWSADGKTSMFFLTEGGETDLAHSQTTHLVFDQVGQERFLREVVVAGETGRQLLVSSAESQAEGAAARAASATAQPRPAD